ILIYVVSACRIIFAITIILVFFVPSYRLLAIVAGVTALTFAIAAAYNPDTNIYVWPFYATQDGTFYPLPGPAFSTYPPLLGDMDGLMHEAFARDILWNIKEGHFAEAAEGGEPSFYYMPGMRYLLAALLRVFGDGNFGVMFFALIMPLALVCF